MANRYLYIVARTAPGLYEELSNRFASDPSVKVILDRRHDEPQSGTTTFPEGDPRRQRDRRRNEVAQGWLRQQSFAVVTLPAEAPSESR